MARHSLSSSSMVLLASSMMILMLFGTGCHLVIRPVSGTEITWHENKDNGADKYHPARTAPKSQKYWDEHGIERPEYAKTDDEVYREAISASWWPHPIIMGIVLGLTAGMVVGLWLLHGSGLGKQLKEAGAGHRLDDSHRWLFASQPSMETARQARLRRFHATATDRIAVDDYIDGDNNSSNNNKID